MCHSSYQGIVELFRDLFNLSLSIGTVHNRLEAAATTAAEINKTQDLSGIEMRLHDEIYQLNLPVLVGVDTTSTYCYLLQGAAHQDEDTWAVRIHRIKLEQWIAKAKMSGCMLID